MPHEMMRAAMIGMVILVVPAFLICASIAIMALRRCAEDVDENGSNDGEGGSPTGRANPAAPTAGRRQSPGRRATREKVTS